MATVKESGLPPRPWDADDVKELFMREDNAWAREDVLPSIIELEDDMQLWATIERWLREFGKGLWSMYCKARRKWATHLKVVTPDGEEVALTCLLHRLGCPEGESLPGHVCPPNYTIEKTAVYHKGNPIAFAPMVITQLLEDNVNGCTMAELSWPEGQKWHKVVVSRAVMTSGRDLRAKIGGLPGAPIHEKSAQAMSEYLSAYEAVNRSVIRRGLFNSRYGWTDDTYSNFVLRDVQDAGQIGRAITRRGELEPWVAAAARAAASPMYFVPLLASVASMLVGPVGAERFVLDIAGMTSRGKSTGLYLAASVWGDPVGLVTSWGNTQNAMSAMSSILGDIPLFCDESMKVRHPSMVASVIHDLVDATGRQRATVTGGLADSRPVGSCMLSTGEFCLHDFAGVGQGATSRIFSMHGDAARKLDGSCFDGQDSDEFKRVFRANHGWLAVELWWWATNKAKNNGWQFVQQDYQMYIDSALALMANAGMYKGSAVRHRIAKKLALFMLAWDVIREAMPQLDQAVFSSGIAIDDSYWLEVMKLIGASGSEDAAAQWKKALDEYLAWIDSNGHRIYRDGLDAKLAAPNNGWIGRVLRVDVQSQYADKLGAGTEFVAIATAEFERWAKSLGYVPKQLKSAWHDSGILMSNMSKRPLWRARSIGGKARVAYIAVMPDQDASTI